MPKTSRSEQMDYKGLEIIADEFTGKVNGSVVNAAITALTPLAGGADLAAVIVKVNAIIAALKS